jgi:hypothetical protein
MSEQLPLDQAIWEWCRQQGITFPDSTGTMTIAGVDVPVEVPADLVDATASEPPA